MIEPRCPDCEGTTWRYVDGMAVVRCGCFSARQGIIGLPQPYRKASLETFTRRPGTKVGLEAAARWLTGTHDLYLSGGVGSGKTHLAVGLGAKSKGRVMFVEVPRLIDRARKADVGAGDVEDPLPALREADLVVLDDVGSVEKASDFTLRVLLTLYNARLGGGLRTIWTSNRTLSELATWCEDDRLTSRIAGAAELVHLTADDYRVSGPKMRAAGDDER